MYAIETNMPFANYLAAPGLSSSFLRAFLRSPAHSQVPKADTPAMLVGRAIHCLALEGEKAFNERFVSSPSFSGTGSRKARADFMAENIGKDLLTLDQEDTARACADSLLAHPVAGKLITEGVTEVSVFWEMAGMQCKARYDVVGEDYEGRGPYIADVKKTQDAGAWAFRRAAIYDYRYDIQAAFYTMCPDAPQQFLFLAVEEKPPFGVAVYRAGMDTIEAARAEIMEALPRIQECQESGVWPGYTTEIQEI